MKTNINTRIQNLEWLKTQASEEIHLQKKKISLAIEKIIENNFEVSENTNIDLQREIMLAKIFWLNKKQIEKLKMDYKAQLNLTDTLNAAEIFWKSQQNKNQNIQFT